MKPSTLVSMMRKRLFKVASPGTWDRYKLLCGPAGVETKLYDLQLDPGEQSNLAAVCPVFCNFLKTRAHRWQARLEAQITAGNGSQIELNQQERERLRTLGYL